MITENDLLQAITECQAERDPDANTCKKLAAFYIIYNQLYGKPDTLRVSEQGQKRSAGYSCDAQQTETPNIIDIRSGSEFARRVNGRKVDDILPVVDDLISALSVINPRLYRITMNKLK